MKQSVFATNNDFNAVSQHTNIKIKKNEKNTNIWFKLWSWQKKVLVMMDHKITTEWSSDKFPIEISLFEAAKLTNIDDLDKNVYIGYASSS